jgi:hypothetical protein
LAKFNRGFLGLVVGTYRKKLDVSTKNGGYTEDARCFVPICQLRKEANLMHYTPDEILERCKTGIMTALIKKAASLANENDKLREKLSNTASKLHPGDRAED